MPVFDYRCDDCNYVKKNILVKNYNKKIICEKCGKEMKKIPCSPNLKFRGKGFYETDYKNKKK